MKVLVSGVGRSGTTMMYQQIGQMMREAFRAPRYRYEPYLWNLNIRYTDEGRWSPEDLHAYGMHIHRATPLFQSGEHSEHDGFLRYLFGNQSTLGDDPADPDAWLVKIIRGSGRLESYLSAYPDLKVIICLRNPVDTLNSSMGMFSFTGEEFHQSDVPRLLDETAVRFPDLPLPDPDWRSHLSLSLIWWRVFTEWSLKIGRTYPDRCHLFVHELMRMQPEVEIEKIATFLGFSSADTFQINLKKPAGQKISTSHLLASDLAELQPQLDYYADACLSAGATAGQLGSLQDDLLRRYAAQSFLPQIAADRLGRKLSMQLRGDILDGRKHGQRHRPAELNDPVRVPLEKYVRKYADAGTLDLGAYKKLAVPAPARRKGLTFGCAIPAYNNRNTIRDTIFSALDQTMPFDRIVVVDDGSTDGTREVLQDLEGRYASLRICYRKQNGGVSAARDQAIRSLGTDYITQLDGDDCFWPTKNREEAEVVFDDPQSIAFSPILFDRAETTRVIECDAISADETNILDKLLNRELGIPRDLTIPMAAYRDAGGYDYRLSLYEDWDLKLRLAPMPLRWKMSASRFGTVYNRRQTGLSNAMPYLHAAGVTRVFLKNLLGAPHAPPLADRYQLALGAFAGPLGDFVGSLLVRHDAGQLSSNLRSWLTSRDAIALFANTNWLNSLRNSTLRRDNRSLVWTPSVGFAQADAAPPPGQQNGLNWQSAAEASIDVVLLQEAKGLVLDTISPVTDNQVSVSIQGERGKVCEEVFIVPLSSRQGRHFSSTTLSLRARLDEGRYRVILKAKDWWNEAAGRDGGEEKQPRFAVGDVRAISQ